MILQKVVNDNNDMEKFRNCSACIRLHTAILKSVNKVKGITEIPIECTSELGKQLTSLLDKYSLVIDETPPVTTPQRFGNPSYRTWLDRISRIDLSTIIEIPKLKEELEHYIINSFGSKQRVDYGTGHELNFVAFIDGIQDICNCDLEGNDILRIFYTYFKLCCKLIFTYNLEPAGSHGVWGLDDHFHVPYILGSAQLFSQVDPKPVETMQLRSVHEYREKNLYFAAIDFVFKTKRGPVWEHSPMLYDVSQIKRWEKINSGMIKMYDGEVLGKFPVVQHFYCGELFSW